MNFAQAMNALKQILDISSNNTKDNKYGCFNCRESDHWAKDCPKKNPNGQRGISHQEEKGSKENPKMECSRKAKEMAEPGYFPLTRKVRLKSETTKEKSITSIRSVAVETYCTPP